MGSSPVLGGSGGAAPPTGRSELLRDTDNEERCWLCGLAAGPDDTGMFFRSPGGGLGRVVLLQDALEEFFFRQVSDGLGDEVGAAGETFQVLLAISWSICLTS